MDNLNAELNEILHSQFFTDKKRELFRKLQECINLAEECCLTSTVEAQYFVEMEMDKSLDILDLLITTAVLAEAEIKNEQTSVK